MLTLKLILVPLALLCVSLFSQWWGPRVAGWLAGLPIIAGPILFLLVLTNGPEFGAQAATLALAATLSSEMFNIAYARSCRRYGWPIAWLFGIGAWLATAVCLATLPATLPFATMAALFSVVFGFSLLPRGTVILPQVTVAKGQLLARMIAGTVLSFTVVSLSAGIGARWSGLLSVFPLISCIMSVSCHKAYGPEFVVTLLRGMVWGRFSFSAFCLCLSLTLQKQPVYLAFGEATLLALFIQFMTTRLIIAPVRTC
ncbi:hypothetical protein JJJ17_17095 [Paracoccus caeni]|uniref:Uncharacterized protein n=1 Tax=Paracoccus caeni TaxID=657651 RepID=A0A934W158_9RHOB|nr:hypothetical protein [Paracoccus caeni]MBK4217650.1 hypothetical protein [Paracoccus caeni]